MLFQFFVRMPKCTEETSQLVKSKPSQDLIDKSKNNVLQGFQKYAHVENINVS